MVFTRSFFAAVALLSLLSGPASAKIPDEQMEEIRSLTAAVASARYCQLDLNLSEDLYVRFGAESKGLERLIEGIADAHGAPEVADISVIAVEQMAREPEFQQRINSAITPCGEEHLERLSKYRTKVSYDKMIANLQAAETQDGPEPSDTLSKLDYGSARYRRVGEPTVQWHAYLGFVFMNKKVDSALVDGRLREIAELYEDVDDYKPGKVGQPGRCWIQLRPEPNLLTHLIDLFRDNPTFFYEGEKITDSGEWLQFPCERL